MQYLKLETHIPSPPLLQVGCWCVCPESRQPSSAQRWKTSAPEQGVRGRWAERGLLVLWRKATAMLASLTNPALSRFHPEEARQQIRKTAPPALTQAPICHRHCHPLTLFWCVCARENKCVYVCINCCSSHLPFLSKSWQCTDQNPVSCDPLREEMDHRLHTCPALEGAAKTWCTSHVSCCNFRAQCTASLSIIFPCCLSYRKLVLYDLSKS